MNRAARFLSLFFAIIVVPLVFSQRYAAGVGPHQEQKDKPPASAAPASPNADSSPQIPVAPTSDKKRIVVLDFDDTSVGTDVLGDKVDVGKETAELLAERLSKDGSYLLLESKLVAADLAAHNFSKTDRYDREFAVAAGKRLGADGVIVGTVTLFGRDRNARAVPHDEFIRPKIKARAAADVRIIEVASGEIVAAESGRGESKRQATSLTGGGTSGHDFRSGNFGFGSSEFQETILGEALNDMVAQLAAGIVADASRLTPAAAEIAGLVVSVSADGSEIVLNIGAKAGLKIGDQLTVERTVRDLSDTVNGALGKLITKQIGTVRVAEIHDTWSVAGKVSGDGGFKVRDKVKVAAH